jgi:hypothetical protein
VRPVFEMSAAANGDLQAIGLSGSGKVLNRTIEFDEDKTE